MKSIKILLMTILILHPLSYAQSNNSENLKSEIARSFEADLYNPNGGKNFNNSVLKRFDTSKYGKFIFKWAGVIGDTACLIYHAEDPTQDALTWGTKITNFAIRLDKTEGKWVVNAYNIMPGDKVEHYNDWLKSAGCKED